MIRRALGFVFNRWVLLAIIFVCVALTIWIVGPLVSIGEGRPLFTEKSRWITIGVIALLIAAALAWQAWRARRTNAAVVGELMAQPPAEVAKERESPDLAAVRERFEQAFVTLRRARFGDAGLLKGWASRFNGRYVYELPWYLIIGAPGSGKTTALENCGLRFPLNATLGGHAVRGVGGTRNCDWWFTDQAVLIDTAGRFTTQDSDADNDRATWGGFLQMLKRSRPRQPVNGVLVTVSITDLLSRTADEREVYATTVRMRIHELNEALGIRIPIYLLVTKCDLIAGFMDYFATLDKDQRAAAWGSTFPFDAATADNLKAFDAEFDDLLKRLDDGLVDQLQVERDPQRRVRIYGFPNQFAGMRASLKDFLETVFSPSAYERETLLRGVYFISGTQEGTPIDRVMGSVARAFGLERAIIAPNQTAGRSYFLTRLLGDVVFAERGLGGTNLRWERKRLAITIGAYAALATFAVAMLVAWTVSYLGNRHYVDEVARGAEQVRVKALSASANVSADVRTVAPTLDAMRNLGDVGEDSWKLGFGLSQRKKLVAAVHNAYDRMLFALMLPSLELSVEDRLNREYDAPERQYESLKTYLMLHDASHFDADALKQYFDGDWDTRFNRVIDQQQRASLDDHLGQLLAEGASPTLRSQDKTLVDGLRQRMTQKPLPDRVLNRMRAQGLGKDYPDFTIQSAAGNSARLLFSGDSLNRSVPGLYSYDGYHKGFQTQVADVARQLDAEQSWVLGAAEGPDRNVALVDGNGLENQVRTLYLREYTAAWKAFIDAIRIKPLAGSTDAIQIAQLLSASDTPLRPLLKKISRETTLAAPEQPGGVDGLVSGVRKSVVEQGKALAGRLGAPKLVLASDAEKALVDDQFTGIRQLVSPNPDGKAPIDRVIAQIAEVQGSLVAADRAVQSGLAPPPSASTPAMQVEASQLPEPVKSLLTTLTQQGTRQTLAGVRVNLSNEVRADVGDFCQKAFTGRYPFDRNAVREVQPQDFAQVFAPGGKIDQLMTKLGPYVDTSTRTWHFRPVDGVTLASESGGLAQLQRAQAIRDAFFPGTATPTIRVTFKPLEMDPYLSLFSLDVDGQPVRYDHGPLIASTITWPGPRGSGQVRLLVTPAPPPGTPDLLFEGPWALLHLIDRVRMEPTNAPEKFVATFNIAQHWARFEVGATSVRNPLNMPELRDFRCPMGL